MAHEVPYDDPEALRRRLRIRYPIRIDRAIGGGELPNARLQRAFADPAEPNALDRFLSMVHWAWFFVPHVTLVYILLRDDAPRAVRARASRGRRGRWRRPTTSDASGTSRCRRPPRGGRSRTATPTSGVRRLMVDVGERVWGDAWPRLYDSLGGNPWAAMPSLHFGSSVMAALLLRETGPVAGGLGWAYALSLGFALVYLGEHYVTDLAAGAALVAAVRSGEPVADPLVSRASAADPAARARRQRLTARVRLGRPANIRTHVRVRTQTVRCSKRRVEGQETRSRRSSRTQSDRADRWSRSSILVAAIYFLFPKLVGVEDGIRKLGDGDPVWITIAFAFSLLMFASYVGLFKGVIGEQLNLRWSESYQITMAGLAATRLFSAGGAGGIVLTYWALRKAGMPRRQSAARMVAFLVLLYAVYMFTPADRRDPARGRCVRGARPGRPHDRARRRSRAA